MDEENEIQQWLRDHPEFHAETPFSNATPQVNPYEQMVERSERFSLTKTYRGYEEIIAICDDHIERYEKDGELDENNPLVVLLRRLKDKAEHQIKKLKQQFLLDGKTTDEIEQLEEESLKMWRTMLGVLEDEEGIHGHDVGDPFAKETIQTGLFHRQIADLGLVHQNRISGLLELLDLMEDDLLELHPALKDGVTHFAAHVVQTDLNVVVALLQDERGNVETQWGNHLKQEVAFSTDVIDAIHATQDNDYRARAGYESGVMMPLFEADEDASPLFDRFAGYVTRSGRRIKSRSSQGQGTLINLFTQEVEWFGRAFSLAIELREIETFREISAHLADQEDLTPEDVEKIVNSVDYRKSRRF
ncbi:hypothetical protein C0431_13180 [bacterium]|nr:hypothetical protein [bacterium]